MSKYALYLDYEFCSGCHSCEVACRNELGLPLGQWGMKVLEDQPRQLPDGTWSWNYIAYPNASRSTRERAPSPVHIHTRSLFAQGCRRMPPENPSPRLFDMVLAELAQWRDVCFYGIPGYFGVEHFVTMYEVTAHAVNPAPFDFWMLSFELFRKAVDGFAYLNEAERAAVLEGDVLLERFIGCAESFERHLNSLAVLANDAQLVKVTL